LTATKRVRLAAPERRAAVLECALREFSEGSYRGTTTASIARVAGVTEPILYRHFTSKRALFLACLDESWARVRELWEHAVAEEPEPAHWVRAMAFAYRDAAGLRNVVSSLWIQALAEASEDPEIGVYMSRHLGEIHAFVADVYCRAQAAGGVAEGRVPEVEAWIFLAIGLLRAADDRLGGPIDEYFAGIGASRLAWLTGASAPVPAAG
jgi:AcrR family transcriptional regulator